ncbi:NucA/NucB deoxyribonuclease domain-containing protein [Streptomyces sp. KLMMK]|uniref:NucA/NucB deoxyribonuclease domain-containing protein n=1 Tax=Streptomyces sp. KLMMK TaxID=3109353 RepID=UPI002FFFDE63
MRRPLVTVISALGLSVLLTVPAGAATAAPTPDTTDFTIVTEEPAPDPGGTPSFGLDDRKAHQGLPKESAQDMEERMTASRTLQTLKKEGKTPSSLAERKGPDGRPEAPALRRTDPNINVCMENRKTYRTYGWTIDHFFHCQGTTQTLYKQKCRWLIGCYPIGSFRFRATTIGEGYEGQRRIYYGTLLDKIDVKGDVSGLKLRHSIACANLSGSPRCTSEPGNGRTDTLSEWMRDSTGSYHWFNSAHAGDGPDKRAYYNITQRFTGIQGGRHKSVTTGRGGFRCDSASYIPGRSSACVFDVVVPVMSSIGIRDREVRQTARNIRDAQFRPERTKPVYRAKEVPGAPSSGQALTRNYYDKAMQKRSGDRVRATCERYWPGYASRGLQCDEYPFASTYQSAGAQPAHQNYAAKAIPAEDNRKGGERIAEFYKLDRILDSDAFYVHIRS